MTLGVFITAAAAIGWTYVVFPIILIARGSLRPRPVRPADWDPKVTVIVAAYNEEEVIGRKLDNLQSLDYPHDRLQVVVVSDGSTDRTASIVSAAGEGVTLVELPRSGKAAAIGAGVSAATGEILVFTDANSVLDRDALRALVRPFADPEVGGVAGDQRYEPPQHHDESRGEVGYWAIDRALKEAGSRAGNAIAATGALYGIRRSFFRDVPDGVNDDYFLSAGVVAQGGRLVFEAGAVAWEPPARTLDGEFIRKVRIMTRAYRTELELRELLDPRRHGFYSVQIVSHKIMRRAGGIPLTLLLVSSLLEWRRPPMRLIALAQVVGYAAGVLTWILPSGNGRFARVFELPAYFVMSHVAGLWGLWNLVRGRRIDRWDTQRGSGREG